MGNPLTRDNIMQRNFFLCLVAAFVAAAEAFSPAALPALRASSTRARGICNLRMQEDPKSPRRVGASIDADGKSNVWAVEPKMQVENPTGGGGMAKTGIALAAIAAAGAGVFALVSSGALNNAEQL